MDDCIRFRWRGWGIVLVLAGLLAACGPAPTTPAVPTTSASTATSLPAGTIPGVPPSAATPPGAAATPAAGHALDQIALCFYPSAGALDAPSRNREIWEVIQQGAQAVGAKATNFAIQDQTDFGNAIGQLIAGGADVLVIDASTLQVVVLAAARKYPAVYFIGVNPFTDPTAANEVLPNYATLAFADDQAGFLAGALAAQITHTRKVGAIVGFSGLPASWRIGEGYRAGVRYIDSAITAQVEYHDDVDIGRAYNDPAWGQSHAQRQLANGSDVLFTDSSGTGNAALGAVAAYQRQSGQRVFAIGTNIDQYDVFPEARAVLVSSAVRKAGPGVAELIQSITGGTFRGGAHTGEVGLAPFHDLAGQVPATVQTRLQQITRSLNDGTLQTQVPPSKGAAP